MAGPLGQSASTARIHEAEQGITLPDRPRGATPTSAAASGYGEPHRL